MGLWALARKYWALSLALVAAAMASGSLVYAQAEPEEEFIEEPTAPSQPAVKPAPVPETGPAIRQTIPAKDGADDPDQPSPPASAPDVFGVVLGGLDKIAARTAKFEVELAKPIAYNTLVITVYACKTRPPEEPPESSAFLDIEERKPDGTQEKLFSGWMFASSPALNALEHPIYDVWVVSCKTTRPDTATPGGPNS
jgi:hypothetical protein